jgi:hypothetical protein
MSQTEIYTINANQYYNASDVHTKNSAFFYGCNNNPRNIVAKKKLSAETYVYAYTKNDNWIISNKSYCKAKLYLKKDWVNANVQGFDDTKKVIADIEMAPALITLNDNEFFTNCNGKRMEIRIRGDRDKKEFYFSVEDVAKEFELPSLRTTIIDDRKDGYQKNIHYKYFTLASVDNVKKQESKTGNKFLYFTYTGLIRCLYVSRSKNADKFQNWATDILFTHQFGSKSDKRQLASNLLGVHAEAVKQVFKASATSVPAVYLFTLGTVKDLRKSMTIDPKYNDDMIVCKYGKTDNLERRAGEHIATYGSIPNCNLMLKYYSYVDPKNITDAENDIKFVMNGIDGHLEYKNHKEIVVLDPKMLHDMISRQYTAITKVYAGTITDLLMKIKNLENELALEKERTGRLLSEKECQISAKNYEILEQKKLVSELSKDIEINNMRMEIMKLKGK